MAEEVEVAEVAMEAVEVVEAIMIMKLIQNHHQAMMIGKITSIKKKKRWMVQYASLGLGLGLG